MTTRNRPLSPHLQVYRLPLLALISITHRATGVALVVGTFLLAYWLGSAAYGPAAYAEARGVIGSPIGLICMLGWTVSLFYHLLNGARHLLWDIGKGFEIPAAYKSGYFVLAATAVLTVLAWSLGY